MLPNTCINNMISQKRFSVGLIAIAIFLTGATMTLLISGMINIIANGTTNNRRYKNVVRDSSIILLEGKSIPAKGFIHLYDATPYMITNGHIAQTFLVTPVLSAH